MPYLITREEAIDQLKDEAGECLICMINASSPLLLHRGEHCSVVLSQYPRQWGQVMINLHRHVITVSDMEEEEWMEMSRQAYKAARIIERLLKPSRTYIASIGSAENLPMTSPHLHTNIMPVYSTNDKPSEIFTWKHGLYAATEKEWNELLGCLRAEWKKQ